MEKKRRDEIIFRWEKNIEEAKRKGSVYNSLPFYDAILGNKIWV